MRKIYTLRYFNPILSLSLIGLIFLTGCTNYEYDVTTPDGSALAVRKDQDLVVPADPVRLRLRKVESRCVLIIDNPTSDAVTLDGGGSTIVDPTGQSRPIASQLIAAGSYIKLILPPMLNVDPRGPTLQLGFGMFVDATTRPIPAERHADYLDPGVPADYWEWPGEGTIRIILSIKTKDQTVRHEITLRKMKV